MSKRFYNRILSVFLVISTIVSLFAGCAQVNNQTTNPTIDTETIADEILDDLTAEALTLSFEWEDYIGDIETFVYGLLTHELEYKYDVFPAYVELSDGREIYGLGYCDYSECFTNEDETQSFFSAGMLTFCGETPIPKEEFAEGLVIHNIDYSNDQYGFLLKYAADPFIGHCVVFGQYVKYGANAEGQITYTAEEYVRGSCDESIGSLYSYDESRYVLDLDVGEYTPVSGVSLSSQIDFDELEKLINEALENQDANFVQADIINNLYFAQESVTSYLLSLQEETFLGYNVANLVEIANELDPTECLRITDDGLSVIDIETMPKDGATPLVKWLVGATCVIITAAGVVGSTVFLMCPALSAASGAITGAAIDVFMQVVIAGESLDGVDWQKVALSAVTGAVTGFLGPYIMAATSGVGYFFADTTLDALMGGVEYAVISWLDGGDGLSMIKSFGYGFALGFALSAGFKGAGKLFELLGKGVSAAANKIAPKLTATICEKFSGAADIIFAPVGNALAKLQKSADSSIFYSKYLANEMAFRQLAKLADNGMDDLADDAIKQIVKNNLVDADGNPLTEEALRKLFKNAKDGEVIAQLVKGKDVINVVKQNGIVGIVFDPDQYITVNITRLVDNRKVNFKKAAEKLKETWLEDPMSMPAGISTAIRESGKTLETITPNQLVDIIQTRSNGFVLHENIDMKTITLVPRSLHDAMEGGFSHMGGFRLAEYLKAHMGSAYFERLLAAASSGFATGMQMAILGGR